MTRNPRLLTSGLRAGNVSGSATEAIYVSHCSAIPDRTQPGCRVRRTDPWRSAAPAAWSLSDPTRGDIWADGVLQALQPGSFQVRACASNAPSICGAVTTAVVAVPASGFAPAVTLTPETAAISPGQTVEFLASASNFVPSGWTWLTLDSATASISASGLLTARRAGVSVVVACAMSLPHYCASALVRVQ